MSEIHPEMSAGQIAAQAIASEIAEISDINLEFLRVLTHPATRACEGLLGLDRPILDALRQLTADDLHAVARSPLLLVEFDPLPGAIGSAGETGAGRLAGVADHSVLPVVASQQWQRELDAFADRLLTCLWQAARREHSHATLCAGLDAMRYQELSRLTFTRISRSYRHAAGCMRARLGSHPHFWPDLIRSVHTGTHLQQTASQLSIIQLSAVRRAEPASPATHISHHPDYLQ